MTDLITSDRAAQNPALALLAASNADYLASLITAASDVVRGTCRRDFTLQSYSEYRSGGNDPRQPLLLRQFPVIAITRVAAWPRQALLVNNSDSINNQRATVQTTTSGLRLCRVSAATTLTTDLAWTDYPTLAALAAAVNGLSFGWSATAGAFANWPSVDLKPLQGAITTLQGGAWLELYTESITAFPAGLPWAESFGWRLDDATGELFARLPRGHLNVRIDYSAGFDPIPEAVAEACVQIAQDLYQATQVNSSLKKATLGSSAIELKDTIQSAQVSGKARLLLASYIDHGKAILW